MAAPFKLTALPPASVAPDSEWYAKKPMVDGVFKFIGGERLPFSGEVADVTSPILDASAGVRAVIGKVAQFGTEDAVAAVKAAAAAWDRGQGAWPQMSLEQRIVAIEALVANLSKIRSQLVEVLMWEICKSTGDAAKEFDRTMDFIKLVIDQLKKDPTLSGGFADWTAVSGVTAKVRRGPIGVMLALAPFNYPLNEMYAMLIPALLMGNVAVLKLPAVGGYAHARSFAIRARLRAALCLGANAPSLTPPPLLPHAQAGPPDDR
jgi:glyceraldehyde-3-phosphate dehydrogenase (NADP+)